MDWNNINTNRDTSGLGPIEYDQTKVPPLVTKYANNVRTKTYGQENRESIARASEYTGLVANESNLIAKDASIISKDTQNRFNDQIAGTTNSDEVIDARRAFGGDVAFQTLGARLDDDSVSPDYFSGNDLQKIQKAITFVMSTQGGTVRFSRVYDITGLGSIYLDKVDAKDRRVVTFLGDGGGIIKNDAGFIFDSNINNSGDWFFTNVRFESTVGAGTTVFNGGKIIRIHFTDCHLRNVDHYGTSENRFFQTVNINGGSAVGGAGWLFDSPCYYDVKFAGGFFAEHREHFLRQTLETTGSWRSINGLRVIGCMMEGLSGKTFEFTRVEQLTIQGNYFESNKQGYIDFTQADYLDAVNISDNRVFHHPDTNINNLTSFIQWGGRLRGVSTRNNFSRYLAMHDTTEAVSSVNYTVFSSQDVALDNSRNDIPNIDPNGQVFKNIKPYKLVNDDNNGSVFSRYTATTDVNTMIATGTYHIGSSAPNTANSSGWGFLEVTNAGSFIMQKYFSRGGATGLSFIRFRENNVWTDWVIMSDPR